MALSIVIALLVVLLVGLGALEYARLCRQRDAIPIRIHVNGTRGKSSVVRLIAAALRAHGLRVYAKTTGALPRLIAPDGAEFPVYRPGLTNVRRIIGVSTYGSPRTSVRAINDNGRRTLTRALRISCGLRTRVSWFGLYAIDTSTDHQRQEFATKVERAMAALK